MRDILKKGANGLESEGDPKIKVFRDGKVRKTLKKSFRVWESEGDPKNKGVRRQEREGDTKKVFQRWESEIKTITIVVKSWMEKG